MVVKDGHPFLLGKAMNCSSLTKPFVVDQLGNQKVALPSHQLTLQSLFNRDLLRPRITNYGHRRSYTLSGMAVV